jgi:hypothetical protein
MSECFDIELKEYRINELKCINGTSTLELSKNGIVIKKFEYPTYKIWNLAVHFEDIIAGIENGSEEACFAMAGSTGLAEGNSMTETEKKIILLIDKVIGSNPTYVNNPNGHDYWECPYCSSSERVSRDTNLLLGDMNHDEDCAYILATTIRLEKNKVITEYSTIGKKMNCLEIIKRFLKNNGFDGLVNDGECGCELSDLVPCDDDFSLCLPGYKVIPPDDVDTEMDYFICTDKDSKPWEWIY